VLTDLTVDVRDKQMKDHTRIGLAQATNRSKRGPGDVTAQPLIGPLILRLPWEAGVSF
jgi:hypothetical protein